jgi:hypothetical protein
MTHGAPAKKNPANDDEEVIPPPDGGWGWAVVFGSFMIHIIGIEFTRQNNLKKRIQTVGEDYISVSRLVSLSVNQFIIILQLTDSRTRWEFLSSI